MQYSRIRATPLLVDCSQVLALSHKDVKLSEALNVVNGELDAPLDLHIPEVTAVHGHHTSTQLGAQRNKNVVLIDEIYWIIHILQPATCSKRAEAGHFLFIVLHHLFF